MFSSMNSKYFLIRSTQSPLQEAFFCFWSFYHDYMMNHEGAKFEIAEGLPALGVPSHEVLEGRGVNRLQPLNVAVQHVGPGLAVKQDSTMSFCFSKS